MSRAIRIAIASGKGGTGKTTVATNLAVVLAETGIRTAYADCDVEEPNGHLFLRPTLHATHDVTIPVPEVDETRCTLCGACGAACRYSAIVTLPNQVLTFPRLCHGCGGCTLACPTGAIRETPRVTGAVEEGVAGQVLFVAGKLNIGEAMAPPVVRAVLEAAPGVDTLVLDAPPGTSCPVIASVRTADVVLLVTEPTPFGLSDLRLAVQMVRELGLPFGVAVNRAGAGDRAVYEYCAAEGISVLLEIPNDRRIAQAYSRGQLCSDVMVELKPRWLELHTRLRELVRTHRPRSVARPAIVPPDDAGGETPASELVVLGRKRRDLDELVVISGKGGTGKTSIVASFVVLAQRAAMADCDVDAPDLHLVLGPTVRQRRPFSGGQRAVIDPALCAGCERCVHLCRFGAIGASAASTYDGYEVDALSCEGCGVCVDQCPEHAAALVATSNGEWYLSETRHGPMVHARLGIAQENSGKLVSLVRREAKAAAEAGQSELLVCDGSPGIGCPVIASISGARMVLVVTEPTLSGLHDLRRVAELCGQLNVQAAVCINKADLNPDVADAIDAEASRWGMRVLGRVRYDEAVTTAQVSQRAVVEQGDSPASLEIRALWTRVRAAMATRVSARAGGPLAPSSERVMR
jgi:MinD superfamily P-loop ATPase